MADPLLGQVPEVSGSLQDVTLHLHGAFQQWHLCYRGPGSEERSPSCLNCFPQ